jgi:hypothetical protein
MLLYKVQLFISGSLILMIFYLFLVKSLLWRWDLLSQSLGAHWKHRQIIRGEHIECCIYHRQNNNFNTALANVWGFRFITCDSHHLNLTAQAFPQNLPFSFKYPRIDAVPENPAVPCPISPLTDLGLVLRFRTRRSGDFEMFWRHLELCPA